MMTENQCTKPFTTLTFVNILLSPFPLFRARLGCGDSSSHELSSQDCQHQAGQDAGVSYALMSSFYERLKKTKGGILLK